MKYLKAAILSSSLISLLTQAGCGKTAKDDACALVDDNLSPDPSASLKPDAMVVKFHISTTMNSFVRKSIANYIDFGPPICTPKAFKEKINQQMHLYGSDPKYNIRYEYAGAVPNVTDYGEIPINGDFYLMLGIGAAGVNFGKSPQPLNSTTGSTFGPWGPLQDQYNLKNPPLTAYPGGTGVIMDANYNYSMMLHEFGHGLGLSHAPTGTSIMSYEGNPASGSMADAPEQEYLHFSEQDRADLISEAPAAGVIPYSIQGKVTTTEDVKLCSTTNSLYETSSCFPLNAYAVDTATGRTFTSQSVYEDTPESPFAFKFKINISEPGSYRVFVRVNHSGAVALDPTDFSPSWFVDNTTATNDPYAGHVFILTPSNAVEKGLVIPLIHEPVPFFLENLVTRPSFVDGFDPYGILAFHPSFMSQGESGTAYIDNRKPYQGSPIKHWAAITSVTPYGTSPDLAITNFTDFTTAPWVDSTTHYSMTLTAAANALPGARLVLARAATGNVYATLIGIGILNKDARKPSFVRMELEKQLTGEFDFTTLDPTYWR